MKSILTFSLIFAVAAVGVYAQKKIDIAKKIVDATPEVLPQSPGDGRKLSDAQMGNLKGKVKTVTEYAIQYEMGKTEKELVQEQFYGPDGNLIRAVDYEGGLPRWVTVYGYLDGMRVSRTGAVAYSGNEQAGTPKMVVTMAVDPKAPTPKRDTRYDTAYRFKFDDQGRLVEKVILENTSAPRMRDVYKYETPERRRVLHFYADAKEPIAQTAEIFDKNGNETERWLHDEDNKVNSIRPSAYEFDLQGNWTVKKTVEKVTENDKTTLKPVYTGFRMITYYP